MYQVKIKKMPNLPKARHGGNYLNYYQMAPSFTSKDLSDPDLSYIKNLGPVDRDLANVEAEKGEEVLMPGPGGMLTKYGIGGNRHPQGGTPLNLPVGSFIFSDFHGKDFKLGGNSKTKITDKGILDYFGLPEKKGGYTFADISKKYDLNTDVAKLLDPTEVKDKMTIDTLLANIKNKTRKLGALAIAQESKKGESAPKMAMPFIAAMNMEAEDFDIPKIPIDQMPFYQNFLNSAQQMDQARAAQEQESAQQSADEMDAQYAQDMGQYMQRMGGSSFPNPFYPGRVPEEMPEAMLGYQVFRDGGPLTKFIKNTNNPYLKKAALGMSMVDPCPPDHYWDADKGECVPLGKSVPTREQLYNPEGPYNQWLDELNYRRNHSNYQDWVGQQRQKYIDDNFKGEKYIIDENGLRVPTPEFRDFQDNNEGYKEIKNKYQYLKKDHSIDMHPDYKEQNFFDKDKEWDEESKQIYNELFNTDDPNGDVHREYERRMMKEDFYKKQNPGKMPEYDFRNPEPFNQFYKENIEPIQLSPEQIIQGNYDNWCPCMKKKVIDFVEGRPITQDVCVPCDEVPTAMLGYQVFKDGGETGLGRFIYKAKKGPSDFDFDNIVQRNYNKRKGVYIYVDANGNKYESTEPDLAVSDMQFPAAPPASGSDQPAATETKQPRYDVPKDATVIERKKGESDEAWAKRKQEEYDKAGNKANVYVKIEDKYYKTGSRSKGYGEYKGSEDELKKVFNNNKDLAAMYQKLEETFKDPKVSAEYVKRVREAVKNDENLGKKAKGDFKNKVINGTITDDQIVQAFLDHNKRNIGFAAHGYKVSDTPQNADLGYTSTQLDKWSKEMGLDIKKDNVMLEQLSYIGYRDLINDRDKLTDTDVKSKLSGFNISQFGKNDEITALGKGQVSDADEYYTNTTAGQVAGIDPGTELFDEEAKLIKESERVPAGDFGTLRQRPPAQPWLQNLLGTGAALLQDVNRYMPVRTQVPYVAQVDPQFISPIYRSQQAASIARGMMEGMSPYMGDQQASARQSLLFGDVADKAAQAAAQVEEYNAQSTDKSNQYNAQARMQGAQAQSAADAEYYTNVVGSKAIFDKNKQLKNLNILRNTIATIDNMAKTDAINYIYGDQFMIDPMSGGLIVQTSGKSPSGQLEASETNSILNAFKAAKNNPEYADMDPEDLKDLVIAQYNMNKYGSAGDRRKKTMANSIMNAYTSPMMGLLSAYTAGMNPYAQQAQEDPYGYGL